MLIMRCSQLGQIMTNPTNKSEVLSVGAKTYLKKLAREHVYGFVEFVSNKYMEKGVEVEQDSIDLYNRVNFTSHEKNAKRVTTDLLTGECDIEASDRIIDIKSSWSLATFPVLPEDCHSSEYEWQGRGYMMLYNKPMFELAYCMIPTPDHLIGKFDQLDLHQVSKIPEHMRITSKLYERDEAKEQAIVTKIKAAQEYFADIVEQIKKAHGE